MKIRCQTLIATVGLLCFSQLAIAGNTCYERMPYTVQTTQCDYQFYPDVETQITIPYDRTFSGNVNCVAVDEFQITRFNTIDFHAAYHVGGIWSYINSSDPALDNELTDWVRDLGRDQSWVVGQSYYYSGYLTNRTVNTETKYQYVPIQCPGAPGGPSNH
ncbi:MAG: hypothetical protein HRT35_11530 [Algicola sp.]|nr:hypothetical protein [Algicola sp.]